MICLVVGFCLTLNESLSTPPSTGSGRPSGRLKGNVLFLTHKNNVSPNMQARIQEFSQGGCEILEREKRKIVYLTIIIK